MKIGICTSLDNLEFSEQLGFDFIEPAASTIAAMTDEEFENARKLAANSRIHCEAFNVLFPGGMHLVGEQHDMDAVRSYIERAFARIAKLGGQTVVFGSGGARGIPSGFDYDTAYKQLVNICRVLGDIARPLNITVVIEPLNGRECNLLNTVRQGFELVQRVNHQNFALLADLYHMKLENEGMDIISKALGHLKHCHISSGVNRAFPLKGNASECSAFLDKLKSIGYEHRISVEGATQNFEKDAAESHSFLRSYFEDTPV